MHRRGECHSRPRAAAGAPAKWKHQVRAAPIHVSELVWRRGRLRFGCAAVACCHADSTAWPTLSCLPSRRTYISVLCSSCGTAVGRCYEAMEDGLQHLESCFLLDASAIRRCVAHSCQASVCSVTMRDPAIFSQ